MMTEHGTDAHATRNGSGGHAGHLPAGGRGLAISGWLTGIYFVVELGIGLWTGSVAVISDAFHTFSAVGGVVIAIVAARLARRPADAARTFGWHRAEIIGALVNGAFLLIMALVVIVMGAMRLGHPIHLPTTPMLIAAGGGLLTEFVSLALLWREQGRNLNVRGAFWHIIQTFVGSLIIIVVALVIHFTGFLAIDPILGMAFGFVLLWAGWKITRDAAHLLMEGTPPDIDLAKSVADLESIDGVVDVHHVHAWALTSGRNAFSAHLRIEPERSSNAGQILQEAHDRLSHGHEVYFATLQIETVCLDEAITADIDVAGSAREG